METPEQMNGTPVSAEATKKLQAPKHSKWETIGLDFTSKGTDEITSFDEETDQEAWRTHAGWKMKPIKVELPVVPSVGGVSTYGEPITRKAAVKMITHGKWAKLREALHKASTEAGDSDDKKKAYERLQNTQLAVTFSRETLLFMLAQPECAGIKFYFCTNHDGHQSLVLVGVNGSNNDLGTNGSIVPNKNEEFTLKEEKATDEATLIYEVGGPRSVKDFLDYFKSENKNNNTKMNEFAKTVGEYFS